MIQRKVQDKFELEKNDPPLPNYMGNLDLPHPSTQLDDQTEHKMDTASSDDDDWHSAVSADSILADTDIVAFRAFWGRSSGRLIMYPSGIRFVRSVKGTELWNLPFVEMKEMRKFRGGRKGASKLSSILSRRWLEFIGVNDQSYALEVVRDRDEAFNYIIGFSNLQWQSLQSGLQEATEDD